MPRRLISLLLTALAIAFAFGAMTAVRWPSIVMVMGWIVTDDVAGGLNAIDWRKLGIAHGGAYLLAAVCYYAAAATIAARKPGAVLWYIMGMAASIPTIFLVHFDPEWWLNPSAGEGAMAGLAAAALLLLIAVWELRYRSPEELAEEREMLEAAPAPVYQAAPVVAAPPRKRPPVFIADVVVQRQRAMFIAQARRKKQRRAEAIARRRGQLDIAEDDEG
ncbi:hypothetical protein HPO_15081 [Hyphomonas polymorpha PS728]|uniref:Uncharacterized protein n=1 Tax=Hyphomonas polymorpha PS728 TaxID=1280954 RepID=A0A062VHH7_9PROT|nr:MULTISPECIES: hypothetical protein [Hyphomonas]AXE65665.1 hypothetical protein BBF93_16595 [Hyphomonas sp. CACIAM 19H1]KCZ97514.1 hypothetical protein HPO_15081 [Hyphomonas polymorpha PS728]